MKRGSREIHVTVSREIHMKQISREIHVKLVSREIHTRRFCLCTYHQETQTSQIWTIGGFQGPPVAHLVELNCPTD